MHMPIDDAVAEESTGRPIIVPKWHRVVRVPNPSRIIPFDPGRENVFMNIGPVLLYFGWVSPADRRDKSLHEHWRYLNGYGKDAIYFPHKGEDTITVDGIQVEYLGKPAYTEFSKGTMKVDGQKMEHFEQPTNGELSGDNPKHR